jgi:hypothetical protein
MLPWVPQLKNYFASDWDTAAGIPGGKSLPAPCQVVEEAAMVGLHKVGGGAVINLDHPNE